jgi:hypothetical protein
MTEQQGQQQMPTPLPEPEWYKNPPSWWNQRQERQAPPPQNYPTPGPSNNDLLTAMQRMPEQVVNAIREATQAVAQQQAQQQTQQPQQPQQQVQQQPQRDNSPRQASFAEKWFGIEAS